MCKEVKCFILIISNNEINNRNTTLSVPESNRKIADREKLDTLSTQIYDRSFSWLGAGTSIKRSGAKIVSWTQTSPLSEKRVKVY